MASEAPQDLFQDIDRLIDGEVSRPKFKVAEGLIPLKRAPNPIIFAESPKFLGIEELFPSQFIILRDFFELLCPMCNDVKRIKLKDDVPRNDQLLFEYDVCPKCGLNKYNVVDQFVFYNELVGCAGMRGSKSALAAMIAHSMVHEVLTSENLQKILGLIEHQTIEGAFVAVSSEQAEETVWDHFINFYKASPWYQHYRKSLKHLESENRDKYKRGDLISDEAGNELYFGDRKLRIKSLHSNSGSLVGRTRLFSVVDELSRFDSGESRRSANEVYRAMKRSLSTITAAVNKLRQQGVYNVPDARMISISSPIFREDRTMRLLKEAVGQPRMYGFHKWTEEMNPNITYDDLAPEFERDPVGAERDYHANPPGAENPFITDETVVEACIDRERRSMFDLKEVFFDRKHEKTGTVFKYVKVEVTNMRWLNMVDYYIHCDPGESGDSFCIGIGHKENDRAIIDGAIEIRPIRKQNPQSLEPRKVHFPSVTKLILSLNNTISIAAVSYDKWNSTDQIQQLIDAGILAVAKNLDRDDHLELKNGMKNDKVSLPTREMENIDPTVIRNVPCAKAVYELKRLHDNGHKVDHPPEGSNDVIQTYVGVHRLLMTPEKVLKKQDVEKVMKPKQIYSGGRPTRIGRVVRLRR